MAEAIAIVARVEERSPEQIAARLRIGPADVMNNRYCRVIAKAIAQAERRAAEAQREADAIVADGAKVRGASSHYNRACANVAEAIRTAPLATQAGDPAPAANLASDLNLGGGLNDPKSGSATAADVRAAAPRHHESDGSGERENRPRPPARRARRAGR